MGCVQLDLERRPDRHHQPGQHDRQLSGAAERGAGLLGTSVGFLVFLLLMLAAVQVLFHLYATSMVTAAAVDAARAVAGHDAAGDRCAAPVTEAEAALREDLGDYGREGQLDLTWVCNDPEVVRLRIRVVHPSILPTTVRAWFPLGSIDRTIETRVERAR